MLSKNNDENFLQKSSAKNKIATIFFVNTTRGFVRRNFIGHHGWNGRESTNQLRQHISHIATLHFLFHRLPYTISPTSLQPGMTFLCFSRPPRCSKDHGSRNKNIGIFTHTLISREIRCQLLHLKPYIHIVSGVIFYLGRGGCDLGGGV